MENCIHIDNFLSPDEIAYIINDESNNIKINQIVSNIKNKEKVTKHSVKLSNNVEDKLVKMFNNDNDSNSHSTFDWPISVKGHTKIHADDAQNVIMIYLTDTENSFLNYQH